MRITPVDIVNQKFTVRFRGYDRKQVDDFLQQLYEDHGAVVAELATLKAAAERAQERLRHYENIEETLRNALVLAQSTLEDTRERARAERDAIVREAEQHARGILDEVTRERAKLEAELADLKRQRIAFETQFAALLRGHLNQLDGGREKPARAAAADREEPEPDNGKPQDHEVAAAGASAVGWWEEDC